MFAVERVEKNAIQKNWRRTKIECRFRRVRMEQLV